MSGCKIHVEDLPGLFTFSLFIISTKKGQFQNLNFPPNVLKFLKLCLETGSCFA